MFVKNSISLRHSRTCEPPLLKLFWAINPITDSSSWIFHAVKFPLHILSWLVDLSSRVNISCEISHRINGLTRLLDDITKYSINLDNLVDPLDIFRCKKYLNLTVSYGNHSLVYRNLEYSWRKLLVSTFAQLRTTFITKLSLLCSSRNIFTWQCQSTLAFTLCTCNTLSTETYDSD